MTRTWLRIALLALGLGALGAPAAAQAMKLIHSERSLYRDVLVYEYSGQRCVCFTRMCRVGRQSCYELREPTHFVIVDLAIVRTDAVLDRVVELAAEVDLGAVGEVAAVVEAHAQDCFAWFHQGLVDRCIGL